MRVTHAKTSGQADSTDTSLIQPSDWNAEHLVEGGVTLQPPIANVDRSGLVTEQLTKLQDKSDETLAALRAAGVIQA